MKKVVISGAKGYLIAGERAALNLKQIVRETKKITPYYFSSLFEKDLQNNSVSTLSREDYVLVVGQYFDYKGLDIAVEVAKKTPHITYKFVGMGKRTNLFRKELNVDELSNIEVIDFLQKKDLEKEYARCKMLFLPSRQECWGLVINEAASYGTPIVATKGAGAAVEFLGNEYNNYLAEPQDVNTLVKIIDTVHSNDNLEYGLYLLEKSKMYNIEMNVRQHLLAVEGM